MHAPIHTHPCPHTSSTDTRTHRHRHTTHTTNSLTHTHCTFCACLEMHWPACLRSGEERGHALGVGALKRRPRVPAPPPTLLQKQMCHECLFRYICKHVLIEAMRDLRVAVYGQVCVHVDANREPILLTKNCGHVTSTTRIGYVCNQEVSRPKKKVVSA